MRTGCTAKHSISIKRPKHKSYFMSTIYFITHPNVTIDPSIAIPDWELSDVGRLRMRKMFNLEWVNSIERIYCSDERKATDGAKILADHLQLSFNKNKNLGENDRSSTGYLPSEEFEFVADQFFASPSQSIRGWETALNAQARVINTIKEIIDSEDRNAPIAIISHGAVGTLLLCHLNKWSISREHDQPGNGGGNYFAFDSDTLQVHHGWIAIDA